MRFDSGARVEITGEGPNSVIRVSDGDRVRTYNLDGSPTTRGDTWLSRDPENGQPYVLRDGTRVYVEAGPNPLARGDGASLRAETERGWSVSTSRDGDVTMRAPSDRGGSLEVTRGADGSTRVSSPRYEAEAGHGSLRVSGPGRVEGGSDGTDVRVTDGVTATTVRGGGEGAGPGDRTAETRSVREPSRQYGESSGPESSVSTGDDGSQVWARDNEVHTALPPSRDPVTLDSGGRTVDAGPDGLWARGSGRDSDRWEVAADRRGTRGDNGDQSIDVRARRGYLAANAEAVAAAGDSARPAPRAVRDGRPRRRDVAGGQ